MIQPPTEEQLAELWWRALMPGEREMWTDEALAEIAEGRLPASSKDVFPLACWRLYWSRGPQLGQDDLDRISGGDCPVCRRRGFVVGPMGGASVSGATLNIECAQLDCRSRFNVAFYSGQAVMGHHLPNGATSQSWPSEPNWVGE